MRLLFDRMAARPEINIFRALPSAQFAELRRRLVLMVLSTDMSRHFGMLQDVRQAWDSLSHACHRPILHYLSSHLSCVPRVCLSCRHILLPSLPSNRFLIPLYRRFRPRHELGQARQPLLSGLQRRSTR